jgi:hypothetical protein
MTRTEAKRKENRPKVLPIYKGAEYLRQLKEQKREIERQAEERLRQQHDLW